MDGSQFDRFVQSIDGALTRRATTVVLGGLLAAPVVLHERVGAEKKRNKKKKKKPQPCGGACGACQACFNGACARIANGTVCPGNGVCFEGECTTCPSGRVPVNGQCAKPCSTNADCGQPGVLCLPFHSDFQRRFCMIEEDFDTAQDCYYGSPSGCGGKDLCMIFTAPKCLSPA